MIYTRTLLQPVRNNLFKGKAIIIYGARQVGKTTLVKEVLQQYLDRGIYFNCDEPDIRVALTNKTSTELKNLIGLHDLVIIDEAQRVTNIGLTLKLLIDTFPTIQVIATGSSSFDLANRINEPLTGRARTFILYPLALDEIADTPLAANRFLDRLMIYGSYPSVVQAAGVEAAETISHIANQYLYKDLLNFDFIRNTHVLDKLLKALALQLGSEVSYNELASLVEVNKQTVEQYIALFEQAFIIFRLGPFKRNLRTELGKLRKVYFYDLGIRNSLINNFNALDLRNDVGALWENFCIIERRKQNSYTGRLVNYYFWRDYQKHEIDLVEEAGGALRGYEFKWRKEKINAPSIFTKTYPQSSFTLVNSENYLQKFLKIG